MLQSLLWDDEVREARFPALDERVRVSAQELQMSSTLVESFAADFTPEKFKDDYQAQLRQLIDAKLEQGDALDTDATFGERAEESTGEVIDLMEALRRSIDKNKRPPASDGGTPPPRSKKSRPAGKTRTAEPTSKRQTRPRKNVDRDAG